MVQKGWSMLWWGLCDMVEGDGVQVGITLALLSHGRHNSRGLLVLVLGLRYLEVDGRRWSGLLPAS